MVYKRPTVIGGVGYNAPRPSGVAHAYLGQCLYRETLTKALADEKDVGITPEDPRRVPIMLIDELEYVLRQSTAATFLAALGRPAADPTGPEISLTPAFGIGAERPYPFADELDALVPVWPPEGIRDEAG